MLNYYRVVMKCRSVPAVSVRASYVKQREFAFKKELHVDPKATLDVVIKFKMWKYMHVTN